MNPDLLAPVRYSEAIASEARREHVCAEAELDRAIVAARAGGATIPQLMEAANRSRQGIYNALNRAN